MTAITASMVKELREKTGAGMMDCKAALAETNGDMDAAIDWLRAKGISKAEKKADRVAADGLVGMKVEANKGALVEVNSETDFVARNESFQDMVRVIAGVALDKDGDVDALKQADYPGAGKSVEEHVKDMVGTIGENMNVRRSASISSDGTVVGYLHNSEADGLGKIGVLVAIAGDGDMSAIGKQVAMHIAAMNPLALSSDQLDPEVVSRERTVLIEQAKESGKPQEIAEKMVEGRIRKFYEESCLLSQKFVVDPDKSVEQAVKDAGGEVTEYARLALGEGIEKEEGDFAAEVAAAASGQ